MEPETILLAVWVIVRLQSQQGLSASQRSFNTHTQKKQLNKQIPASTKTGKTSTCVVLLVYVCVCVCVNVRVTLTPW